ncbi:hypothetical protein [Argonema galeatum]|nr:hypothetical protein [Argonema galeatum]MCL1464561.1 hypothetical protein [Argonema galeatum A003/A1]
MCCEKFVAIAIDPSYLSVTSVLSSSAERSQTTARLVAQKPGIYRDA